MGRGVGRSHGQLPLVEYLEHHFRSVTVQRRRIHPMFLFIHFLRVLHYQNGGRLGEMPVEQLIQFVAGVDPDQAGRYHPGHRYDPQDQNQQTALQRMGLGVHCTGASRNSMYPTPRTVWMSEPPSLRRKLWMCTSMALLSTSCPQL